MTDVANNTVLMNSGSVLIVPDIKACLLCCSYDTKRFYKIIDRYGKRASAYDAVKYYFGSPVAEIPPNNGSYLCQICMRVLQRMLRLEETIRQLRSKLRSTCQKVVVQEISKPVSLTSPAPCNAQKSVDEESIARNQECLDSNGNENTMPDALSKSIDNAAGLPSFCLMAAPVSSSSSPIVSFRPCPNLSVMGNNSSTIRLNQPFVKIEKPCLRARQITLTFRSVPHAMRFSPVCRMLQNGSTRKAIKTLMQISTKENDQNALTGIHDYVRNEVTLAKKDSSDVFKGSKVQDLNTIELQDIVNGAKKVAPVLWSILSAAIGPKEDLRLKRNHLLSAFSILLHGRSQQLNAFQYLVSHSLHENNLDKDGYAALNSLGICVSYHSIYYKMVDVRDQEQLLGESSERTMENDGEQTMENDGEQTMESDGEQTMKTDEEQTMENDIEQTIKNEGEKTMENDGKQTMENEWEQIIENVEPTMKNEGEQTMENDWEQLIENVVEKTIKNEGEQTMENNGKQMMENDGEQTMENDWEQIIENVVEQTIKNEGEQNITDHTHHDRRATASVLKRFTSKLWSQVFNDAIVDKNKETNIEDNDNEELI